VEKSVKTVNPGTRDEITVYEVCDYDSGGPYYYSTFCFPDERRKKRTRGLWDAPQQAIDAAVACRELSSP